MYYNLICILYALLCGQNFILVKSGCYTHKEYVTFGDDKKGKILGSNIIKVNDHFTLNDVTLVDKLRYNLLSVSQLVDADLDVLFCKV
jgi:hypothetical protein